MTLIHSALAGGDSIDDADCSALRYHPGGVGPRRGRPLYPRNLLRSFTWGHARQRDKVSAQLLARAFAAGAGAGKRR